MRENLQTLSVRTYTVCNCRQLVWWSGRSFYNRTTTGSRSLSHRDGWRVAITYCIAYLFFPNVESVRIINQEEEEFSIELNVYIRSLHDENVTERRTKLNQEKRERETSFFLPFFFSLEVCVCIEEVGSLFFISQEKMRDDVQSLNHLSSAVLARRCQGLSLSFHRCSSFKIQEMKLLVRSPHVTKGTS